MKYRVLCKQTMVYLDASEGYVVVTLQRNWLGRAEIVDIGDAIDFTDLMEEAMGGWQEPETPAMTEAATAAFNKAADGLVGVDYRPVYDAQALGAFLWAKSQKCICCKNTFCAFLQMFTKIKFWKRKRQQTLSLLARMCYNYNCPCERNRILSAIGAQ